MVALSVVSLHPIQQVQSPLIAEAYLPALPFALSGAVALCGNTVDGDTNGLDHRASPWAWALGAVDRKGRRQLPLISLHSADKASSHPSVVHPICNESDKRTHSETLSVSHSGTSSITQRTDTANVSLSTTARLSLSMSAEVSHSDTASGGTPNAATPTASSFTLRLPTNPPSVPQALLSTATNTVSSAATPTQVLITFTISEPRELPTLQDDPPPLQEKRKEAERATSASSSPVGLSSPPRRGAK